MGKKIKAFDRYKYVVHGNEVIAISTYEGRPVRAVAYCHPDDNFNEEVGKKLAALRCNVKVAKKRFARAKGLLKVKQRALEWITRECEKAESYYNDAEDKLTEAEAEVVDFENSLCQ